MQRKTALIAAIGALLVLAIAAAGNCQDSTGVFVVYGTVYEPDSITVHDEAGFIITVRNMTTGRENEVPLSAYDGVGKYSAVWIQYSDSSAVASAGDVIGVFAYHPGLPGECSDATCVVTPEDIGNNCVEIDVYCPVAVAHRSWGAIKTIYRR